MHVVNTFSGIARVKPYQNSQFRIGRFQSIDNHLQFVPARSFAKLVAGSKSVKSGKDMVKNEAITHPELRVVYKNETSGVDEHKVMSRLEALNFARSLSLDLILVSASSTPPVCKVENSGLLRLEKEKKVKEIKARAKTRAVKEMHVGCNISSHDLDVKMNKVREFLDSKHPVKISFIGKPKEIAVNPLAVDQVIMKVLELLEKDASTVQPLRTKSMLRKDVLFSPRKE